MSVTRRGIRWKVCFRVPLESKEREAIEFLPNFSTVYFQQRKEIIREASKP